MADRVVAGQSAEDLLPRVSTGNKTYGVQRKDSLVQMDARGVGVDDLRNVNKNPDAGPGKAEDKSQAVRTIARQFVLIYEKQKNGLEALASELNEEEIPNKKGGWKQALLDIAVTAALQAAFGPLGRAIGKRVSLALALTEGSSTQKAISATVRKAIVSSASLVVQGTTSEAVKKMPKTTKQTGSRPKTIFIDKQRDVLLNAKVIGARRFSEFESKLNSNNVSLNAVNKLQAGLEKWLLSDQLKEDYKRQATFAYVNLRADWAHGRGKDNKLDTDKVNAKDTSQEGMLGIEFKITQGGHSPRNMSHGLKITEMNLEGIHKNILKRWQREGYRLGQLPVERVFNHAMGWRLPQVYYWQGRGPKRWVHAYTHLNNSKAGTGFGVHRDGTPWYYPSELPLVVQKWYAALGQGREDGWDMDSRQAPQASDVIKGLEKTLRLLNQRTVKNVK